jgi:Flp pilus assembly pilin Flp
MVRAFLAEDRGAETSEIALVLGILIVAAAAIWGTLKNQIKIAVENAGAKIAGGG